jgi:LemA protein
VLALSVALPGCSYNKFTGQEEQVKSSWSEVQNQLQRRNDLIPNLVATTKGYASHEEEIYKDIADSRSKLIGAKTPEDTIAAANQQTSALNRLLAVVENYPNLKADEQFNRLMDELSGTENRITVARKRYNDAVQAYNTSRHQFPGVITAKAFSFKDYPYFEAPQSVQTPPKVDFSKK